MSNTMTLAEMVNSANYASMSYEELVTINFAFSLALFDIKPLIPIKKAEEMAAHTHEYVAKMKCYCATKDEIRACIEKEMIYSSVTTQSVDDLTFDDVPGEVVNDCHENREASLLLPAPKDVDADASRDALVETCSKEDETVQDETAVSSPEDDSQTVIPEYQDEEKNMSEPDSVDDDDTYETKEPEIKDVIITKTKEQTLVEKALEKSRTMSIPKDIDVNTPYYIKQSFTFKKTGAIESWGTRTRKNLGIKDLEAFRVATEKYESLFIKNKVLASTDDYLVTYDGVKNVFVYRYHLSEESVLQEDLDRENSILTGEEIKAIKKSNALMKRAIKKAKELSALGESEANVPFYDRYIFKHHGCNRLDLYGDRKRVYEDVATLKEIMPAFETYARLFDDYRVLIKDNCIAAMDGSRIFVVLFNFPTQEKKKRVTKKSKPIIKDITAPEESASVTNTSTAQSVRTTIIKAVEMTKALPVSNGTNVNVPYYVQQEYVITNDGGILPDGRTFSTNISIDTLDKNKAAHRKLARSMKASSIVSADDYTAFIRNEGKNVCVYSYHV